MTELTKRKWTGGEWQKQYTESDLVKFQVSSGALTLAMICSGLKDGEEEANAHLFAGSKKLFEALELAGNQITENEIEAVALGGRVALHFTLEELQQIQAALQAALGDGE